MPLFSIIITAFNQELFIRDAVDSALAQSFPSKEVIVVDDASGDSTVNILEEYGDKIRLIKTATNQGANMARNSGAAVATGEYLVFLDGDDLFLSWALQTYQRLIDLKKPKILLCRLVFFTGQIPTPQFSDFGQDLQIVEYDALIRKDRTYRGSVSAIVVDRHTFESVGGWDKHLFPAEIEDLTMKLGYSGSVIHILSHPTIAYRIHANNTVHQIARFLDGMQTIVRREKTGQYPGGRRFRYERYAYIGGPIFHWFKKALVTGIYWPAVKFLARGWPMILAAIVSKLGVKIKGRRPAETIPLLESCDLYRTQSFHR